MDVQHYRHLVHHFQVCDFFPPRLETGHFQVASVQCELATPESVLPAPPASSPCSDANGGTDLQVFDASDCLTSGRLDAKGGVERVLGKGGLLENR